MSVPAEIRAVPRPVNTIVENTGRPGPKQYPVRSRADTKYVPGGNPQPHNGRVIGHIIDGRFVPRVEQAAPSGPDMLSYGLSAFVWSVSGDIFKDLEAVFGVERAHALYAVAALRAQNPRVSDGRLMGEYERCFLSKFCPGLTLAKDFIERLASDIGKDAEKRSAFFKRRKAALNVGHHVALGGLAMQVAGEVDDLADYMREPQTKGGVGVLLLYAYDLETGEPLCYKVCSGSCNSAGALRDFAQVCDNGGGILVADDGLFPNEIRNRLAGSEGLHYLAPVKMSDFQIKSRGLCERQGVLQEPDHNILYKKTDLGGGRFLYAFADADPDVEENRTRLEEAGEARVLESDLDLEPATVFGNRRKQRLLGLAFKQYRRAGHFDQAGEPSAFSAIGTEFVNFIATLITVRLVAKAEAIGLLDGQAFGDLKGDLSQAWRKTGSSAEPASDDGEWVHAMKQALEALEALGLSKPVPRPGPKKRGRPRKDPGPKPEFVGPKRPCGRPRRLHPVGEA